MFQLTYGFQTSELHFLCPTRRSKPHPHFYNKPVNYTFYALQEGQNHIHIFITNVRNYKTDNLFRKE